MSAAERMRAYRERQREGDTVVRVLVPAEMLIVLVDGGFLHRDDTDDRAKVAQAIERMHEVLRVTTFAPEVR